MNNEQDKIKKNLDSALMLAKKNDIQGVRATLSISEEVADNHIIESLIALDKGIEFLSTQKHVESVKYFKIALQILEFSNDEEAQFLIPIFLQFAEGLTALFNGDAHLATKLLNMSSETIERMSFFKPELRIASYSFKAASLIALARSHLNSADINTGERVFSEARSVHDELLNILDPTNSEHLMGFAEVYGTRLELSFLFIIMMDLPALDLSMWKKRLDASKSDVDSLNELLDKLPRGNIQVLLSQYPVVFSVLLNLHRSIELAILKRKPFNKEQVKILVNIDTELFHARQQCQKLGARGKGMLLQIDLLRRLQQNVLQVGKAATQDFGRFSGLVSLISFAVTVFVMHYTSAEKASLGTIHYLGALVLSLIVGFGYGALRFQPLLRVFSEAMQKSPKSE